MATLTASELAGYSDEHLAYEIQTLWQAACVLHALLSHPVNHELTTSVRNVYLDSFAIHARVLHDFFYSPPKADDVSAQHFVSNWTEICPKKPALLAIIPNKANKQVAHLTLERLAYEENGKGWDFLGVFYHFAELLTLLKNNATPDSLGDGVKKLIDYLSSKPIRLFEVTPIFDQGFQSGLTMKMLLVRKDHESLDSSSGN